MAELLRMGYTMLNIACPVCNNPIFRSKEGEKLCPSCNRKVVVMTDNSIQNYVKSEDIPKHSETVSDISEKNTIKSIKLVIDKKMQLILAKLENETEVELIKKYSDVLSDLFDLFKKLS
ncbi:MAG: hypothetical protein KGD58_01200 [Candidatus Lokiarchaeota archaeon]|nr:hypothetical protein [Candidatus Lokiarchaeota archaeon]